VIDGVGDKGGEIVDSGSIANQRKKKSNEKRTRYRQLTARAGTGELRKPAR
jgi:hypothetical protein